jgi:Leucine-rich repeat (LRR) protein
MNAPISHSHNALTNVIEPNFDGLYSLRELYLNHNQIKSIVSAAFRHASRLQILSLAHNRLEGKDTKYKVNPHSKHDARIQRR